MAVTLPKIIITFKQLATSYIQRSERGIVVLIVRDDTRGTGGAFFPYGDATCDAYHITAPDPAGTWSAACMEQALADAAAIFTQYEKTGWITFAEGKSNDWTELSSWIKAREAEGKSWKALCFNTTPPDSMHVVNLANEKVTFADDRGEVTGEKYCASLSGLLASCNVVRGATNKLCSNLVRASVPENPDTVVGAGKFILINDDDEVRVGVDVNSMTTTDGSTKTEDMKYIETVEAMDLMRDDIARTFRDEYLGQYRNSRANQMLLVSAINYYFEGLAAENILNPDHSNRADIDTAAQRNAWIGAGKTEAADWDDATVLATPFKRTVFLAGDVQILGSMGSLTFDVTLV